MGFGEIVARQIKGIADRANHGLITQQQAHASMNEYLSHVSDEAKAEARQILNRDLGRR